MRAGRVRDGIVRWRSLGKWVGPLAGGRDDPATLAVDRNLDHRHDDRIAPEAVPLGDQEHVAVADHGECVEQAGPLVEGGRAADPLVGEAPDHHQAGPEGVGVAGVELGIQAGGRLGLLVGRTSPIEYGAHAS
jgi:hypothetical protein